MPLRLPLPADDSIIGLKAFVAAIEGLGDQIGTSEGLIQAAPFLQRLNNNKRFLIEHMVADVVADSWYQRANLYGPQVFILHVSSRYFVRANIWKPISPVEASIEGFRYDICHDHNFDILTSGYFGPGYESRAYTYDYGSVTGMLGETVRLRDEGRFVLREGDVALYRAKHDVHIQLPPPATSVSLNLIPRNAKLREPQFEFEEASHRIRRYLQSSGAELAVRMAGVTDNASLEPELSWIIASGASAPLRAVAIVARSQLTGDWSTHEREPPMVRHLVDQERWRYGAALSPFADAGVGAPTPPR